MRNQKCYTPWLSSEPAGDGRYDITVSPSKDDEINIATALERTLLAEKYFMLDVVKIIEKQLCLKKSLQKKGTLATVALYETENGVLVEIAKDQAYGLMVESEDKEMLQKIYQELILLQT